MLKDYIDKLNEYLALFVSYSRCIWLKINDSDILGSPKDLFVGIVAGIIGGYVTLALVSMRVPRLGIAKSIVKTNGTLRIKVINKRRRWAMFIGDALDIKAVLYGLKLDDLITKPIRLVSDERLEIRHRRFFRKSAQNEFVFRIHSTARDTFNDDFLQNSAVEKLVFKVTAKDSFSNYSGTAVQVFFDRNDSRKSRYAPLIEGDFAGPGDLRIRPLTNKK